MKQRMRAKVLTVQDLKKQQPLPESWKKAIGILKKQSIDPLTYQKEIRQEWKERLETLEENT